MKFFIFVEGHAERMAIRDFLARWLNPQLHQPVAITPIKFKGSGDLQKDVAKRAKLILNDPRDGADVLAVISLLDFYGAKFSYPKGIDSVEDKCRWAKQDIEQRVAEPRFRHFFAVHEFEAWLLSQPAIFPADIHRCLPHRAPEGVNLSEPPKALLRRLYRETTARNYKETVNGPDLFRKLNPVEAYAKCPNLQALLDEMLQLARTAGIA